MKKYHKIQTVFHYVERRSFTETELRPLAYYNDRTHVADRTARKLQVRLLPRYYSEKDTGKETNTLS